MSEIVLGRLADKNQERDAIHVAVIPLTASEMLRPGQRIGLVSEGVAGPCAEKDTLGIVDPFLTDVVPKGTVFWMCLLPNTVAGMRHHWSHPCFSGTSPKAEATTEKSASEVWLRETAKSLGISYDDMIDEYSPLILGDYINNGEYIRDIWYSVQDEFWHHYKIVTGRDVPEIRRGGFTCSC